MTTSHADQRIGAGVRRMLETRQVAIGEGARAIGWKLGFGSPAGMERLGTSRALPGFLTDATLLASGADVDVNGWRNPMIESELAVHMTTDLEGGSDHDEIAAAIGGLGAAIELVDIDVNDRNIETVMAGNLFHRGVILGPSDPTRAGARRHGLTARVLKDGELSTASSDWEGFTGEVLSVIGSLADLLTAAGEGLRAGDIVITGAVAPPLSGLSLSEVTFELAPLRPISVRIIHSLGQ